MNPSDRQVIWIVNQYASTPDTGIGGRHYYLARALARQGHRVYLISSSYNHLLRHPRTMRRPVETDEIEPGFTFVWIRMPCYTDAHDKRRIWNWVSFAWKLTRLPRYLEYKPEAIVASSPAPFVFLGARQLARRFGACLAFEVRDIWPLSLIQIGGYKPDHPFIRLVQWIENTAYRDADRVLSVLPNALEHMRAHGLDDERFIWIPNGFDLAEVAESEPLSDDIEATLPRDKFIVGYAGTLGFANSLDYFVEAAGLARDEADIAWVIVGDGKEKNRLRGKAKALGLQNLVFIDAIPKAQVQSMLGRFDVSYIGLTRDPLFRFGVSPNKLFDYLYAARPVLYGIDSGDYRPVDAAGAGRSIVPEDAEALHDAVLELRALPAEELRAMGEAGRLYALQNHEYSQLARKLAKALQTEDSS